MRYAIANLSMIPVRKEPAEQSEMVTQVLFGEHYKIIEETEKWNRIEMAFDGYIGWIDRKMVFEVSETYYQLLDENEPFVTTEPVNRVVCKLKSPALIVAGSSLPDFDKERNIFQINNISCVFAGGYSKINTSNIRQSILVEANKYLNAPYLWGGRTPFGIDCSGFSQIVYKINGFKIPRDASQQIKKGRELKSRDEVLPGDLAFFHNEKGRITHVGIMINKEEIIHASGKVRVDKIDQKGIFNEDINQYTHDLTMIRNLIDTGE